MIKEARIKIEERIGLGKYYRLELVDKNFGIFHYMNGFTITVVRSKRGVTLSAYDREENLVTTEFL